MKLWQQKAIHFIKFSSISIIGTLLEYVVFFFVVRALNKVLEKTLADGIATAFCYILAAIFCYVMNKIFVYKSKKKSISEVIKFFAIAIPKLALTTFSVPFIIQLLNVENSFLKTVINAVIQSILFFAGYIFQTIWVFKKTSEINKDSEE